MPFQFGNSLPHRGFQFDFKLIHPWEKGQVRRGRKDSHARRSRSYSSWTMDRDKIKSAMSLLQQDSRELDDAARGESFTKGSSHVVWASVVAVLVVTAAIAAYVITGQKPPAATGDIEQVWVHPQHTQTSGFDANGAPMASEAFDQVYVFTKVKLHNQGKLPLFLHSIMTNATLDDGIHSSYAATPTDYNRIYVAYPNMPVPRGTPLSTQATIQPGDSAEGIFVSAFRLTKQQWDARKDLNFTVGIQYQPSLTLTPHTPVIDQ
jgi:hypothetical protein